jgi:hypothetical protein
MMRPSISYDTRSTRCRRQHDLCGFALYSSSSPTPPVTEFSTVIPMAIGSSVAVPVVHEIAGRGKRTLFHDFSYKVATWHECARAFHFAHYDW